MENVDWEEEHFKLHTEIDLLEMQDSLSPYEEVRLKEVKKLRLRAKEKMAA